MHENINHIMLYIHPPLAILGYIFIFANLTATLKYISDEQFKRHAEITGLCAWFFVLSGIVSGMLWAQVAWGSYWSWDPKETSNLLLFLSTTAYLIMFYKGKKKILFFSNILSIILIFLTVFSPALWGGLH
ncbi:MAG: cytochrome c biogenesis protein [Candidatus Thermoplasmatota archaeon]|nr:cytochrome c biogenesis protein [Candidatus Thermoplasmatota archaeon]